MKRRRMSKELIAARREIMRARLSSSSTTCGASRHVQMIADGLAEKGMIAGVTLDPASAEHCALSMYAAIAALYDLRTKTAKGAKP